MFSFSKLGQHGNLGNQLFEIASVIGLAEKHGVDYVFPPWQYAQYFEGTFPQDPELKYDIQVNEPHYHFADLTIDTGRKVDILGWLQSEKYWEDCSDKIRDLFTFKREFHLSLFEKNIDLFSRGRTVAVSVRRGDYVGNENYHQVSLEYYLQAAEMFPGANFLVFSDDFKYCREYLPADWRLMEGFNAIEQLALGSMCDHFIIANSSFSWWMAYLGDKGGTVIAPAFWNAGPLLKTSDDCDVVPKHWVRFNPDAIEVEKIDLSDVTFTIPVRYDHQDRKMNLELSLRYLNHYFNTNIIVAEMDYAPRFDYLKDQLTYLFYPLERSFERTRLLNDMAHLAKTPIIVNWDCDVFMEPEQILQAVELIRTGQASGAYPYDGRFFRCKRDIYFHEFRKSLQFSIFSGKPFPESQYKVLSVGGAVIWNKNDFIEGGMENEFMIHYGPEDRERYDRFVKLGYKIARVKGPLFHMDHFLGNNGSKGHQFFKGNDEEYSKIRNMSPEELRSYVNTWPWINPYIEKKFNRIFSPLYDLQPDHIYCLNLPRRNDRRECMTELFKKIGIVKYEFFPAVDGKLLGYTHWDKRITPGMIGCWKTHKAILKDALDHNLETIIIFEDDIDPIPSFNHFLEMALPQIPPDWEFTYLGCTEYGGIKDYKEKINEFWVVPKCAWGTQAMMIRSRKAIQRIYDMLDKPQERQIDEELANHVLPESGLKYYAIFPSAVGQQYEELGTDVQERTVKKQL